MIKRFGTILSILGIITTIIIVSPNDIYKNAKDWEYILISKELIFLYSGIILGVLSYYLYTLFNQNSVYHKKIFITAEEFEKLFYDLLESEVFTEIKIFGYTGETVTDYFKYSHRYKKSMKLKILNRHWLSEKNDEELHNERLKDTDIRPWDKSRAIKHLAERPINFELQVETRYYNIHPLVKAIILINEKRTVAFFSFYYWDEMPKLGGSQFKGSALPMLFIEGIGDSDKQILINLETQFDYLWKISKPHNQTVVSK